MRRSRGGADVEKALLLPGWPHDPGTAAAGSDWPATCFLRYRNAIVDRVDHLDHEPFAQIPGSR